MTAPTTDRIVRYGLQGVVAADTRLSRVDGERGELLLAGYKLEDIAPHATFEQMLYLLWHDTLPTQAQLNDFSGQLKVLRQLPDIAFDVLEAAAQKQLPIMDALRMASGLLSLSAPEKDNRAQALTMIAAIPTIVAAYWRLLNNENTISPDDNLSHAANYLYMLAGKKPDAAYTRALDTYLNTVIDHGFNASTFAGRVIISTHSDMVSAIVGAIGALKGPIHGGAPGPALDMVFEIGKPENAEAYLRDKLETGERLMGFGHRVYKVRDPRADVLNAEAERFFVSEEQREFYHLARYVEQTALDLLEEYKPERRLQTNVEFYTALILHGIGLPTALFTPTFAVARVGGWTAHALEHLDNGRILRPLANYVGDVDKEWVDKTEQ